MNDKSSSQPLHVVTAESDERKRGPLAGRTMGSFQLHSEIAAGGMAAVYLGYKKGPGGFGQLGAVKVMHPHLAWRREYVDMFLDEARIGASINHPNVVQVYDFGQSDSTYYLAMEHLTGQTWSAVQRRMQQNGSPRDLYLLPLLTAWMVSHACEGLHAAHEAKDVRGKPLHVVHRDISPQNLFVTYDGSVRVLDFGIARADARLHATKHGTVKGRFAYMAPEQMQSQHVDRRADIWSLGVVLWEGLAGRALFRRDVEAATMAAVCEGRIPTLPGDIAPVPDELLAIAMRALQVDPNKRFASARDMGTALSQFIAQHHTMSTSDMSTEMHRLFGPSIQAEENLRREAAGEPPAEVTTSDLMRSALAQQWWPKPIQHNDESIEDTIDDSLEGCLDSTLDKPMDSLLEQSLDSTLGRTIDVPLDESVNATFAENDGVRPATSLSKPDLSAVRAVPTVGSVRPARRGIAWLAVFCGLAALGGALRVTLTEGHVPATPTVISVPVGGAVSDAPEPGVEQSPKPRRANSIGTVGRAAEEPQDEDEGGAKEQAADAKKRAADARKRARRERARAQREQRARRKARAAEQARRKARAAAQARKAERAAEKASRDREKGATNGEAPSTPGVLNVTTPGCWAVVFVDGHKVGTSPGSFKLPSGNRSVEVAPFGVRSTDRKRVALNPDKTTRLRVACK